MNRTKSIFAAIGVSIIMSLLAACGAPSDVPMIADMKQVGVEANAGKDLGELANNTLIASKFNTTGSFNWSKTTWESPKSIDETKEFYSQEALAAAGWNAPDMPECVDTDNGYHVCLMAKATGDTSTVLLTNVYPQDGKVYVVLIRIEGMKPAAS
jgi:hypothetical protein